MHGYGQGGLSVALLTLATAGIQACTAEPKMRDFAQQPASRLAVVQAGNGFIIQGLVSPTPATSTFQPNTILLGDNVRFDRSALLPINPKETPHGETR